MAKQKEEKSKTNPTQLTDEQLRLQEVEEAREEVRQAEEAWEEAKTAAKMAHEAFDMAILKLRSAGKPMPLFEKQPAGDGEWKSVAVSELDITEAMAKKLIEAGINTLGDMSEYQKTKELSMIDGIGPASADKIADASEKYFREHPITDDSDESADDEDTVTIE